MSNDALRKNLEILIKKHNFQIADLERKANVKKNNIYNIVKGIIKKPAAETLQNVASVFKISVEDLFQEKESESLLLDANNLQLLKMTIVKVIDNIVSQQITASYDDIIEIINKVFDYSNDTKLTQPDEKFIKWLIKYKFEETL